MLTNILGEEWFLSPEGLDIVTKNGSIKNVKEIIKNALNSDLKVIGKGIPANELNKTKIGKVVLQIQKIRNIAAPKAKETSQVAPRMLKLNLTDGENYLAAIEISPITSISREYTAPGTKVLIDGAETVAGYLLINSTNCKILGGKVDNLYEKWLLTKSIQENHQYNVSTTGAPPWVAFGREIISLNDQGDALFKSLDKGVKDGPQNVEFEQQRKDAIAEATSTNTTRKTFGGRVKQNAQYNPSSQQNKGRNKTVHDNKRKEKFEDTTTDTRPQKRTEKLSLFSFLEDKLPTVAEVKKTTTSMPPNKTIVNSQRNDKNNQKDLKKNNESKLGNGREMIKINSNNQLNSSSQNQLQFNSRNYNGNNVKKHNNYGNYNTSEERKYYNKKNYNNNSSTNQTKWESGNYEEKGKQQQSQVPLTTTTAKRPQQIPNNKSTLNDAAAAAAAAATNVHNLATNISRLSVNNEFASRSLRQHLNLDSNNVRKIENNTKVTFFAGDQCMAKYWEDGKFYNATITGITDKTYVVQFNDYGNIEEVLKHDCKALSNNYGRKSGSSSSSSGTNNK